MDGKKIIFGVGIVLLNFFIIFGAGNKIIFGAGKIFIGNYIIFGAGIVEAPFISRFRFILSRNTTPPEKFFGTLRREPKIFN